MYHYFTIINPQIQKGSIRNIADDGETKEDVSSAEDSKWTCNSKVEKRQMMKNCYQRSMSKIIRVQTYGLCCLVGTSK